jgi:hypothetical protein
VHACLFVETLQAIDLADEGRREEALCLELIAFVEQRNAACGFVDLEWRQLRGDSVRL